MVAGGDWRPSKKKSIERIDRIAALIMSLDRATRDCPLDQDVGPVFA